MNAWKLAGVVLVAIVTLAIILDHSPPEQQRMILCAMMPNCVYVVGGGQ